MLKSVAAYFPRQVMLFFLESFCLVLEKTRSLLEII